MGYPSEEQFEDARRHRAPPTKRPQPDPIKSWGWRPFEPSRDVGMLHVVSGALIHDGRVLMGLRKKDGLRPDLWELPGGKVDPGELPHQALAREWREECGCAVHVGDLISSAMFHIDISFVVDLYALTLIGDIQPPRALDHQELRWVSPLQAVQRMPCSPAFYIHYPQLVQFIGART